MKTKNLIIIFFLIIFPFALSGCSEQQQIHQKLIVQGIGVDLFENKYTITVQALDFQNPASEKEPSTKTLEITGNSLVEALENISKQTNLSPVYSQNMILIIHEAVAMRGMNNFIDFFVRHCEARPKVKICVSKNKASEIFKIQSNNKPIKAKNIHDLIPENLDSDILHFISNLKSGIADPYAAWIEIINQDGSENVFLKGAAVFSGDVLKKFIEKDEAIGFMLLKSIPNFEACNINLENMGGVSCLIEEISNKTNVKIENGAPIFEINLNCKSSVFSADKKFDAHFDENIKTLIEDKLSEKIEILCGSVINNCKNFGIDVFDWGKTLKNENAKYFKNVEQNWKNHIRKCGFKINKNVTVNVTGKETL